MNLGCLLILGVGLLTLLCVVVFSVAGVELMARASAGYPIISHFTSHSQSFLGGFNVGGTNSSGQVPEITGNFGLIDLDTPQSAYTIDSFHSPGTELQLVFSDEFETAGRTFYPGDDPYWCVSHVLSGSFSSWPVQGSRRSSLLAGRTL